MKLIILPAPDLLEAGPGRWLPAAGMKEALDSVTFNGELPPGIMFIPSNRKQPAGESITGAYQLSTDLGRVIITANGEKGRWNALMTLRQILRQTDDEGMLPDLSIDDSPAFEERGVMLDISRTRVPTMKTLYEMIDIYAELKFNSLQLYTEHTFAYKGHEKVWKDASPLNGKEIEEIDDYCSDRGMELIPNQNSFGHMERWLRHPEYHELAEAPEGFEDPWGVFREYASTLSPRAPGSMELLKDLFDQLLPHFRSRTFNIGGDEPYDLCVGKSREECRKEGTGKVYLEFLNRIVAEVEKRGYKPQFWADIILNYPELLDEIPKDAVVMNWGYESEHPFEKETAVLAESGREFQVCPGTSSWNSISGRWGNARENIRSAAEYGLKNGAAGLLITDWGDNGHKQQYVVSLPGWMAAAAAAWNGPDGVDEDIQAAMQLHIFTDSRGREAEILLKLGNIYRENPLKLHNMSFLMLPLIDHEYPYYRKQYPEIRQLGMGQSRDIARDVESVLKASDSEETNPWRRQLAFTTEIVSFSVQLAEGFFSSEDFSIEKLPPDIRRSLAAQLEKIMKSYSDLWNENCRPGGLDESLDSFTGLLELLKT